MIYLFAKAADKVVNKVVELVTLKLVHELRETTRLQLDPCWMLLFL